MPAIVAASSLMPIRGAPISTELSPDLVLQLRVYAALAQFRLKHDGIMQAMPLRGCTSVVGGGVANVLDCRTS
jgi:hypothetical protein